MNSDQKWAFLMLMRICDVVAFIGGCILFFFFDTCFKWAALLFMASSAFCHWGYSSKLPPLPDDEEVSNEQG